MNDNQSDVPLPWHTKSAESVMQSLETGTDGLSDRDAKARLKYYGANELQKNRKKASAKCF